MKKLLPPGKPAKVSVVMSRIFQIYFTTLYEDTLPLPNAVVDCICIARNVEEAIAMAKRAYPGKTVESAHNAIDGYGKERLRERRILIA